MIIVVIIIMIVISIVFIIISNYPCRIFVHVKQTCPVVLRLAVPSTSRPVVPIPQKLVPISVASFQR